MGGVSSCGSAEMLSPGSKPSSKRPLSLAKYWLKHHRASAEVGFFDRKPQESFNLPHCRHEPVALTGRKRLENVSRREKELVGERGFEVLT
jgi:hypothetical protein